MGVEWIRDNPGSPLIAFAGIAFTSSPNDGDYADISKYLESHTSNSSVLPMSLGCGGDDGDCI